MNLWHFVEILILTSLPSANCNGGYEMYYDKLLYARQNGNYQIENHNIRGTRRTATVYRISDESCGVRNSDFRIVKGSKAAPGYWPWLAALGYRESSTDPSFQCGGALIAPNVILTAAHCVRSELYTARLGTNDLGGFVGQDWPVEEAIIHAGYNADSNENDIALVKLLIPAKINRFVQLLCLPSEDSNVPIGSRSWIAGWGATSYHGTSSRDLQQLSVSKINTTTCQNAYKEFGASAVFDERVMCAAGEPGRDACQGDSGGPLMWQNDGVFYAIGVISFGYKCAEPGYPGVYTSVPAFVSWIKRHMKYLVDNTAPYAN